MSRKKLEEKEILIDILTEHVIMNNKITVKEVISRLREISQKQKISEQKVIKQKLLQEEIAKKKFAAKNSCKVCGDVVAEIMENSQKLTEDITTLKDMYRNRLYTIKEKGLTLTRDDIEARIEREKCSIQQTFNRYIKCCKEAILL